MKLALSLITKGDDELSSVKRCVASFAPYVDGVFITANSNKTKETEAWCKKKGYNYSYLKWDDDFSKQRNFNISQIKGFDFYVWADSDDELIGGEYLREITTKAHHNSLDCVFLTYWYGCLFNGEPSYENIASVDLIQSRERILKPNVYKWKGRLHETPVPIKGYEPQYTQVKYGKEFPIVYLHLGADRNLSEEKIIERTNRNRRILELQLKEERELGEADPRTLLYLMKIYVESTDNKDWKECIKMGMEYLKKSGWDQERALCCVMIARCLSQLGKENDAKHFIMRAVDEYPYSVLLYLQLSRSCFNLNDFRGMEHWLKIALSMEDDTSNSQINNELEKKILATELTLKLEYLVKKNIRKAYTAVKYLYDINPTNEIKKTRDAIFDLYNLDLASENAHKIIKYLENIGHEEGVIPLIESLPPAIKSLEFCHFYLNKYSQPKVWANNEICYYASFGQPHFEKWSPDSLKKGIGGSETAVIRLAKEWASHGYKVTVYGDPIKEGLYDGVLYLPYWKFNPKDDFNIFIQWRSSHLAGIKAKKFLVDLHDVFSPQAIKWDNIDYAMVKSEYHKSLAKFVSDEKIKVISNGI